MVGPKVEVKVLLGGQIGAPRRHAAGAIIQRADDAIAGSIVAGLQAFVAGRRTVDRHLGERADAAVIATVAHDLPFIAVADDLHDGDAMRSHLDIDELLRHVLEASRVLTFLQAREHQFFIGVFVIDAEDAVLARAIERKIGDVVVVVAELLQLRGRALPERIECRGIREQRIAPAEQAPGTIPFGDMVGKVDARLDLVELEAAGLCLAARLVCGERGRTEQSGRRDHAERAAHHVAAAEAPHNDVADRLGVSGLRPISSCASQAAARLRNGRNSPYASRGMCGQPRDGHDRFAKEENPMAEQLRSAISAGRRRPSRFAARRQDLQPRGLRGQNGTLVMFICNHCPYVKAVIDRIVRDVMSCAGLASARSPSPPTMRCITPRIPSTT